MPASTTARNAPAYRAVPRSLHRPLTIGGVDRRLFFLALLIGAAGFNLFYSLLAGCLVGGLLYGAAWSSAQQDPQMLRIVLRSSDGRVRYDAAQYTPCRLLVELSR